MGQGRAARGVPFYGSWDDRDVIFVGSRSDVVARAQAQGVVMPDPKDVRIAEMEQRLHGFGVELKE
jgi:hypothetical protein